MQKRYAVVGLGDRSRLYTHALLTIFREQGLLVGYCDSNQTRMSVTNRHYAETVGTDPVAMYTANAFDRMIKEQKIDTVIVTSIDGTHHHYIIKAMELGCDVITEKPMTIDEPKCQAILDTQKQTGRSLTVTFNYRYSPHNTQIKSILRSGAIGKVLSVHFEWLLDTWHGADYFRRWHREKENSGGLMVHKAAHHFDLVNWWLETEPESVFGFGATAFYGEENARKRGMTQFYERSHGNPPAQNDPFAIQLEASQDYRELYLEAEHEDGYFRDRSVFSKHIGIEDDMALVLRYRGGAIMTYHLHAYAPWEGYRIAFNGDKGRLEVEIVESVYRIDSRGEGPLPDGLETQPLENYPASRILLRPLWSLPRSISVEEGSGGHSGGDERMLADIFLPRTMPDPWQRAANHIHGALAILPGIAANQSFATGQPVIISDLVTF